ncbi:Discoidin domain-containing receptor 2 [Eufriesea mexicana]|uniref:Discoidin domain-containing receptor 2 n=1 Tax=Eufriesea mexicana TaxID=516756 RepID=A0A310SGY5_9HYME|nr:Discoidin domain-containing receptor 2 [Eufriesea mexicana]
MTNDLELKGSDDDKGNESVGGEWSKIRYANGDVVSWTIREASNPPATETLDGPLVYKDPGDESGGCLVIEESVSAWKWSGNEIKVHLTSDVIALVPAWIDPCGANVSATIKPGKEERTKGGDAGRPHLGECDCAAPIDAARHYAGGRMNRDKRGLTRQKWHGRSHGEKRARVKPSRETGAMVKSFGFFAGRAIPAVHLLLFLAVADTTGAVDLSLATVAVGEGVAVAPETRDTLDIATATFVAPRIRDERFCSIEITWPVIDQLSTPRLKPGVCIDARGRRTSRNGNAIVGLYQMPGLNCDINFPESSEKKCPRFTAIHPGVNRAEAINDVSLSARRSPEPRMAPQCIAPLGMESGTILNADITASSTFDTGNVGPHLARLKVENLGGAWCPKNQITQEAREWLEIDLHTVHLITATATQGRFGNGIGVEYAEAYLLDYWRPRLGNVANGMQDRGINFRKGQSSLSLFGKSVLRSAIPVHPLSSYCLINIDGPLAPALMQQRARRSSLAGSQGRRLRRHVFDLMISRREQLPSLDS